MPKKCSLLQRYIYWLWNNNGATFWEKDTFPFDCQSNAEVDNALCSLDFPRFLELCVWVDFTERLFSSKATDIIDVNVKAIS